MVLSHPNIRYIPPYLLTVIIYLFGSKLLLIFTNPKQHSRLHTADTVKVVRAYLSACSSVHIYYSRHTSHHPARLSSTVFFRVSTFYKNGVGRNTKSLRQTHQPRRTCGASMCCSCVTCGNFPCISHCKHRSVCFLHQFFVDRECAMISGTIKVRLPFLC